jgi:hypothetical protein
MTAVRGVTCDHPLGKSARNGVGPPWRVSRLETTASLDPGSHAEVVFEVQPTLAGHRKRWLIRH